MRLIVKSFLTPMLMARKERVINMTFGKITARVGEAAMVALAGEGPESFRSPVSESTGKILGQRASGFQGQTPEHKGPAFDQS